MKTKLITTACVLTALILTSSAAAADDAPKTHTLPADGKTPVITLDFTGGMIAHVGNEPVMTVRADGAVIITGAHGEGKRVEGTIAPDDLQALLRFILDDQKFTQIKPDDLKLNGMVKVNDGTTASLVVEADGDKHTLSGYAVDVVVTQAGPLSAARFLAIENRLNQLRYLTVAGGDEGVKKELALANAELKKTFPAEPPMTPADLHVAWATEQQTTVTFQKRVNAGMKWHIVSVTVTHEGDKPPKVKAERGADQELRMGGKS